MDTVIIKYEYEDELPEDLIEEQFNAMYECSIVDVVRLYPYVEIEGEKYYLTKRDY